MQQYKCFLQRIGNDNGRKILVVLYVWINWNIYNIIEKKKRKSRMFDNWWIKGRYFSNHCCLLSYRYSSIFFCNKNVTKTNSVVENGFMSVISLHYSLCSFYGKQQDKVEQCIGAIRIDELHLLEMSLFCIYAFPHCILVICYI